REAVYVHAREALRNAPYPRLDLSLAKYEPRRSTVASRVSAYSANLTLISLLVRDSVCVGDLIGDSRDAVAFWHSQAMLWRAYLKPEEWTSVVSAIEIRRSREGAVRNLH